MNKDRAINLKFGARINLLRAEKGYSLKELENLTGISASYINRLEVCERRAPSYPIIEKLAQALGVSIYELLEIGNTIKSQNKSKKKESLYDCLLGSDITMEGKELKPKSKLLLNDLLKTIFQVKWEENKMSEGFKILEHVEKIKQNQAGVKAGKCRGKGREVQG